MRLYLRRYADSFFKVESRPRILLNANLIGRTRKCRKDKCGGTRTKIQINSVGNCKPPKAKPDLVRNGFSRGQTKEDRGFEPGLSRHS